MRAVAAGFLITSDVINTKIGSLSEGQKGLVAFARLVLERPGLLILDEPTTYLDVMSQRIILEAIKKYTGTLLIVSHTEDFLKELKPDRALLLPENQIVTWSDELLDKASLI